MKKNPINYEPGMKNGYIQPPYVLEEGDKIARIAPVVKDDEEPEEDK